MIDSRILEMVFKNKEFEDGVNDSLKSLEKLDRSLGKIDGSDTSVELEKVGGIAEQVGKKFSMFEELATGALRRIGERAADWGIRIAKSLSVDQLKEGWSKYEQKNTAMQTIINNAHDDNGNAYSLEQVNAQMEKLNWFTDETSYNFTDMVNNIGKFTSMGKNLEDSTTAMEGIAVWASSAGQGIGEASRAMYNLSQAMGMGALTTIDFKSIENANMATEEFKKQALESGAAMEMLTKKYDESTKSWKYFTKKGTEVNTENFRSTLSEKWLDSYVLMDTLKEYGKFADKLNEVTNKTGMSATDIVNSNKGLMVQYEAATDKVAFLTDYLKENNIEFEDETYTVEMLADALNTLGSEEYALSKKAFRAAQEYRTFNDAISATKDAVSTGWMNIFEQIVGNYEQAKEVWTQFGDDLWEIFGRGTESILEVLKAWRELEEFGETQGTRSALFESLHMLVATLFDVDYRFKSIAKVIHDAWDEIFPSSVEESALHLANAIIWFTEKVNNFQAFISRNYDSLKNIFKGIFGMVKLLKTLVIAPLKTIITLVKAFTGGAGDSLVTLFGDIGSAVYEFSDKWSEKIGAFFERINNGIIAVRNFFDELSNSASVGNSFKSAIGTFETAFEEFKNGNIAKGIATALFYIKTLIGDAREKFIQFVDTVKSSKSGLVDFFKSPTTLGEKFHKVLIVINDALKKLIDKIKSLKQAEGPFKKFADFFKNIGKILAAVWSVVKEIIGGLVSKFNESMNLKSVADISTILKNVLKIIKAGGLIAIITNVLKIFNKAGKTIDTVKESISKLFGSLSDAIGAWKNTQNVKTIKEVATSLLILAAALFILASIKTDKLIIGVAVMGTMLFIINKFLKSFAKTATEFVKYKAAAKMIAKIGIAMLFLALAVKVMGSLDWKTLAKGVGGISILFLVISVFMKSLQKVDPMAVKSTGTMLTKMALAIRILIWSVERLGKMSLKDLVKGIGGIAALMLMMGLFIKTVSKNAFLAGNDLKKAGAMMVLMAAGMVLFSIAVKRMGSINVKTLAKGIAAMGAIFLEIGIFMKLLKKSGNMISTAFSLILLATAMNIMYYAVRNFGDMPVENVVQGLIATGVALAEFVLALKFINSEDVIAKAGAIAIIAAALLILVPAIEAFGALDPGEVVTALLTIAGVMAIFVVSMYALEPIAPILITAAGAFALFGAAILAIGVGVMALSLGLLMLIPVAGEAVALIGAVIAAIVAGIPGFIAAIGAGIVELILLIAASADAIIAAIVMVVSGVILGLIALAPQLFELISIIIGGVLDILIQHTPAFLEWLGMLISGLLQILNDNTPAFFTWIGELINGLFDIIDTVIPRVFNTIGILIDGLIELLNERIPDLVDAVLNLLVAIMQSLADHVEDFVYAALDFIAGFIRGIADGIPDVIDAAFKLVIAFIDGLADAISNNNEALFDAIDKLLWAVIDAIVNFFKHAWGNIKKAGSDLMESGFVQGIRDKFDKIKKAVSDIVDKIKNWFKEKWETMKEIGGNLVEGLGEGLKSTAANIKDKVADVGEKVTGWFKDVFGIHSPSRVFAEIGEYNMMGLAKGFVDNENLTETAAEKVGEDTLDAFGKIMSQVSDMVDDDMDLTPTITPVLDMSQIQNGSRSLDSYFGNANVGLTASSYNASVSAAREAQYRQDTSSMASALKYYTDKMVSALREQNTNTNVNVTLEGDAAGIFKTVRTQNDLYRASSGRSAFV